MLTFPHRKKQRWARIPVPAFPRSWYFLWNGECEEIGTLISRVPMEKYLTLKCLLAYLTPS